ncbi:MAG: hypothetical protein ACKVT1_02935 [Dehalococcoidia bacterium]
MAAPARTYRFHDLRDGTPEDYARVKEDMRRWLDSPEGIAARERSLAGLARIRQRILAETGGLGMPDEWIQDALDAADDH